MLKFFLSTTSQINIFFKSRSEHIKLIYHLLCVNFIHTVNFWNFEYASTIKRSLEKVDSLVKLFGVVVWIKSTKTHLKGTFGFSGFLGLAFFVNWRNMSWCKKRVCIYPNVIILQNICSFSNHQLSGIYMS